MKLYRADRNKSANIVYVNNTPLDPKPSQKIINHSPDGFEWGYGGSGPAQLALAIMLDYFEGDSRQAVLHYHYFKDEFIASAPKNGFEIYDHEIRQWLIGGKPK